MKKIAIISELNLLNINYGNRLQAFALNKYLTDYYKDYETVSLILGNKQKYKITKLSLKQNIAILLKPILDRRKAKDLTKTFKSRMDLCNIFTENNIKNLYKNFEWNMINKSNFDIYIVGSDIVWNQDPYLINRFKFLDFNTNKTIKKISYAASFGRDYLPDNNIKSIKKYLSSFNGISVREKSSTSMLNKIGINNVSHVCDPTLLLSRKQWEVIEKNPNITNKKFIFVYLLGKSKVQRDYILEFAKNNNYLIINIPNANGVENTVDLNFGDIKFDNCSPENWLWLINHAEYIFTDSFHGIVFSTIFEKKFVALKREGKVDINNRINDYLSTIDQQDKLISLRDLNISSLTWNYKKIDQKLNSFIKQSKDYLDNTIK